MGTLAPELLSKFEAEGGTLFELDGILWVQLPKGKPVSLAFLFVLGQHQQELGALLRAERSWRLGEPVEPVNA